MNKLLVIKIYSNFYIKIMNVTIDNYTTLVTTLNNLQVDGPINGHAPYRTIDAVWEGAISSGIQTLRFSNHCGIISLYLPPITGVTASGGTMGMSLILPADIGPTAPVKIPISVIQDGPAQGYVYIDGLVLTVFPISGPFAPGETVGIEATTVCWTIV